MRWSGATEANRIGKEQCTAPGVAARLTHAAGAGGRTRDWGHEAEVVLDERDSPGPRCGYAAFDRVRTHNRRASNGQKAAERVFESMQTEQRLPTSHELAALLARRRRIVVWPARALQSPRTHWTQAVLRRALAAAADTALTAHAAAPPAASRSRLPLAEFQLGLRVLTTALRSRSSRAARVCRDIGGKHMSEVDSSAAPEELIASLKRKRALTMVFAIGGLVVALAVLFSATGAMYAKDPVRELKTEKAALTPADR